MALWPRRPSDLPTSTRPPDESHSSLTICYQWLLNKGKGGRYVWLGLCLSQYIDRQCKYIYDVGHALPAGLSADPSCVTVQVDWRNAFNTLRRDRILDAVAQHCTALLPMAAWAYGRHSHLLVHQSLGTVVSSQSEVRQGNPLGPLLFALTLQEPLEGFAAMGLARPLAYADDTFLQGALAPTMKHLPPSLPSTLPSASTPSPPSVLSTPGTTRLPPSLQANST
jgi:hypothetical protein